MARILITGSSDGLGSLVTKRLVQRGHSVVLHARNRQRSEDALAACPGAETVMTADLSSAFDCIIHNAGLWKGPYRRTPEGIPALFAVNTIAPYVPTNRVRLPKRLLFVSSERHRKGDSSLKDWLWTQRGENGWDENAAYEDSKLHDVLLAKGFARRWPHIKINSMTPGWVPTKMGGAEAREQLEHAIETYVMLAEGEEQDAQKTGCYFKPGRRLDRADAAADDVTLQDKLLELCAEFSGVELQRGG